MFWINRPDLAMDLGIGQMFSRCQLSDHQIPLYTHPVKELTDEEIAELSDKILCYQIYDNKESGVFEFARAILRKAQNERK